MIPFCEIALKLRQQCILLQSCIGNPIDNTLFRKVTLSGAPTAHFIVKLPYREPRQYKIAESCDVGTSDNREKQIQQPI